MQVIGYFVSRRVCGVLTTTEIRTQIISKMLQLGHGHVFSVAIASYINSEPLFEQMMSFLNNEKPQTEQQVVDFLNSHREREQR